MKYAMRGQSKLPHLSSLHVRRDLLKDIIARFIAEPTDSMISEPCCLLITLASSHVQLNQRAGESSKVNELSLYFAKLTIKQAWVIHWLTSLDNKKRLAVPKRPKKSTRSPLETGALTNVESKKGENNLIYYVLMEKTHNNEAEKWFRIARENKVALEIPRLSCVNSF